MPQELAVETIAHFENHSQVFGFGKHANDFIANTSSKTNLQNPAFRLSGFSARPRKPDRLNAAL
jgi:hypothetical protein